MIPRDKLVITLCIVPISILCLTLAIILVNVFQRLGDQNSFAAESAQSVAESKAMAPVLFTVTISPEARVKATATDGPRVLHQRKWSEFTVDIDNAAGVTAPLAVESDQLMTSDSDPARDHWLRLELYPSGPLTGDVKESRTIRLFSRDAGLRTAVININAGQGTQDLGFRSDVVLSFKIAR